MSAPLPTDEFSLIRAIASRCLPGAPENGVMLGIGDDAALIRPGAAGVLVSVDLLVDGVHFRSDWSTIEQIVHKSWVANLSDINAMGGSPRWIVLGLGIPPSFSPSQKGELVAAIGKCCAKWGVALVGGDTVGSEVLTLSVTVMGTPGTRLLRRDGAVPGQALYLSGTVGASRAGLEQLLSGERDGEWVEHHCAADFPAGLGAWLVSHTETTACIDISDGLFSEAHHIAAASGVRLVIDEEAIPVAPGLRQWLFNRNEAVSPFVAASGEEFQLLFTCSEHFDLSETIFHSMPSSWTVHRIGSVESGAGLFLREKSGALVPVEATGWRHLS